MKTIFALFPDYSQAKAAVDELTADTVEEDELNLMVLAEVAKNTVQVDLHRAAVDATDAVGEKRLAGLDALISTRQPVKVGALGKVYAAGELAGFAVTSAAESGNLAQGLQDLNVDQEAAARYAEGVSDGQWLIWLRAGDADTRGVIAMLETQGGRVTGNYS